MRKDFAIRFVVVMLLLLCRAFSDGQTFLKVIRTRPSLDSTIRLDSSKQMLDLSHAVPGIVLDLRYAGTNNFLHQKIYPAGAAYLRRPAAERLAEAEKDFEAMGFKLIVFDAYRPYTATVLIYSKVLDTDYAASPATGSRHNRGCSVDCSLIKASSGFEIPMPTSFDSFTLQAHSDFAENDPVKRADRALLREIMEKHGFAVLKTEWWHFDFAGWKNFELLDIPFSELKKN